MGQLLNILPSASNQTAASRRTETIVLLDSDDEFEDDINMIAGPMEQKSRPSTTAGSVLLTSPGRGTGTSSSPFEVPEADEADMAAAATMQRKLAEKRKLSSRLPTSDRKRRSASSGSYSSRPKLDADVVPKLPVPERRGDDSRPQLVLRSMDTTSYPDVTSMVDIIMRNDRSVPSEVERTAFNRVVRKNHRNTTGGIVGYANTYAALYL